MKIKKSWNFLEIIFAVAQRRIGKLNRQIKAKEEIISKIDPDNFSSIIDDFLVSGLTQDLERWSQERADHLDVLLFGHPILWPDIIGYLRVSCLANIASYKKGEEGRDQIAENMVFDYIKAIDLAKDVLKQEVAELIEARKICSTTMVCL